MPDATEFKKRRATFTALLNGTHGSGKTTQAMSFPKVYVIGCDPSGLDILYKKGNEKLLNNLAWYEYLHNESEEELKRVFNPRATVADLDSMKGNLLHCKALAKEGKVETLLIDGFNYFVDMRWQYVNEYELRKSDRTGALDTQAMYRDLGLYLQRFFAGDLMTMATRQNISVIATCHLKRETPEAVEGTKQRAGKVNKDSDIAPLIEGGFRQRIEGLVGASIYLEHETRGNIITYKAYTQKSRGLDTVLLAKNRYGLANPLDLTGASLYDALMKSTNLDAVRKDGPTDTVTNDTTSNTKGAQTK